MPYGFVIDQTRCIGCHACTVACKAENDVPLGDFRTWVKYTETGTFPEVRRDFSVLRCNHCTNAPCITICPVVALDKRPDGIVDLDRNVCIGCKSCMQACPYDALYLNEETGGAEKCHYCAHRVDQGLEPACVVVCPEEAIISGDFSDPTSKIAIARNRPDAIVRRPEQGTGPNVHYLGANPVALDPGRAKEPDSYLWSQRRYAAPDYPDDIELAPDTITVLDVNHKLHWGTEVSLYLLTKGISSGAIMLAPLVGLFAANPANNANVCNYLPELLGLAFLSITLLLLVMDLERPEKFLSIMLRPNPKSWLVRGAWVLTGFGAVIAATILARLSGHDNLAETLRYAGILTGASAAGYTAFLFGQCEGRDLWQNTRILLPHLLIQAVMLGAVTMLAWLPSEASLAWLVTIAAIGHLLLALHEAHSSHPTPTARRAASLLPRIPAFGSAKYKAFSLGLGLTTITGLLAPTLAVTGHLNTVTALVLLASCWLGTFLYEQAYLRAGQLPPLS
ncbi:MAG: 4Fe-4S dicluster domain-containing protein [Planctomycetota bacterium]|nr:4Fe-4S dicluster domain-containing protein [Planctomycetota bacterium]